MAKLVSKTYGGALFELAVEEGKEEEFLSEITEIIKLLDENPDFNSLMNHPKILKEEKLEVLENVFKGRISEELLGFLHLVVTKDRYSQINEILDYFVDEVKAAKGIGIAMVTTPTPLSESQKKDVEKRLLETTAFKKMEMHYDIDEELIGGMVIRIGDRVVDSSVRTKLDKLQRELLTLQI